MTSHETTTPGAPVWIDLAVADTAAAAAFYSDLFGWTLMESPMGQALVNGERPIGSLSQNVPDSKRGDGWLVYLLSSDVDSTSLAAHSNGGDVLGRQGEIILVKDSQGALVGAWNPLDRPAYLHSDEAGAPVWHELHAADYDSALEFYENVFEWEPEVMSDTAEFRFVTLGSGADAIAGIYDATVDLAGAPSRWVVYFGVDDADAIVARLIELGGRVTSEVADTPYGRMAHVADAAGNPFAIIQNSAL